MAVICCSGGLDSCILISYLLDKYPLSSLYLITFDYGQKALQKELKATQDIAQHHKIINHSTIEIGILKNFDHDLISSDRKIANASAFANNEKERAEIRRRNFVPFRNLHFALMAASYAKKIGDASVYLGFHKGLTLENCPDATPEFVKAMNDVLDLSILNEDPVDIRAPLLKYEKFEAVKIGKKLSAPFNLSYSCYTGNNKHCGRCANCFHRQEAFLKANLTDPTEYSHKLKLEAFQ